MADVTAPRPSTPAIPGSDAASTDGSRSKPAATADRDVPRPATDARAVRVRVAPAFAGIDDPVLVIAPVDDPQPPTAGTVLAQRHGLVEGEDDAASILSLDATRHRLTAAGEATDVILEPGRPGARGVGVREVLVDGFRFEVETEPERLAALRERATRQRSGSGHSGPLEIRAIIPGRVAAVWVTVGDTVNAGERVLAIEAMKMQNELLAPRDGTIIRLGVAVGGHVEIGDTMVVIE